MKKSLAIFLFAYTAFLATEHFRSKAQVPISGGGGIAGGFGGTVGSGAITQINQQVLVGATASITVSSIPATYTDLYFTFQGRGDTAAQSTNVNATFNGVVTSTYDWAQSGGSTATATAVAFMTVLGMPAASNTANYAAVGKCWIFNYTRTTFQKSMLCEQGDRNVSTPTVALIQTFGEAAATTAISSYTLTPAAGNFIAGTTLTTYGIN
jgi:hypothetical protein